MNLSLTQITANYPYDLLLLADETLDAIHKYLHQSDIYIAKLEGSEAPVAVCCLFPIDKNTIEIKNIAVAEAHQQQGIGSLLLKEIERIACKAHYSEIIVGTGDCGFVQLRFYEMNGFQRYGVRENFFVDNYDKPMYENGIMLKDMVMLRKTPPLS